MALWTDIYSPAELTGYVRAEAELQDNGLARYLPNTTVADIAVEVLLGESGLVPEARYRSYDAEPEFIPGGGESGIMLKLPAVSAQEAISEYRQLRLRGVSDETLRAAIEKTMRRVVRSIIDRTERTRGVVLATGKATATQSNFRLADDFGRDASLTATAAALWSSSTADRVGHLEAFHDVYRSLAGEDAGRLVMDQAAFNALRAGDQFKVSLNNGATRPASNDDVQAIATASGLPEIEVYTRRTSKGAILPSGTILFLPAPVDPNDPESTDLGATVWGQTLSSTEEGYEIAEEDAPGVVVAAHKGESVPHIASVVGDSINLPMLMNGNKSGALKVL